MINQTLKKMGIERISEGHSLLLHLRDECWQSTSAREQPERKSVRKRQKNKVDIESF